MIMRFVLTVRDFGLDLLVAIFLLWVIFLVLLDLGAFVVTSVDTAAPVGGETQGIDETKSGCLKIDDIEICE